MKYVAPEMEMMVVLAADVIATSPDNGNTTPEDEF